MKLRILAVLLIVALAAWLPLAAQQSATPQDSGKPTAKAACRCCCDKSQQDKDKTASTPGHSAMGCCQSKDAKDMACCGKDNKDAKASMDCCKGKDAKMCAKDGKFCCGKDAVACNSKDAKNCCAKASDCCASHAHAT